MPEADPELKGGTTLPKPFPWRCLACRRREVYPATVPYHTEYLHDGCLHPIDIPELTVPRCRACGELIFDNGADEQILRAVRARLHLLGPEQIRANRLAL